LIQWQVGKAVCVIREEDLVVLQIPADTHEALTDVAVQAGIDERHLPVVQVARVQFHTPVRMQREVVRHGLFIAQEIFPNEVATIA
jgi:hypothetical protein